MSFPNFITKFQTALRRIGSLEEAISALEEALASAVQEIKESIRTLTNTVNGKAAKSHAVNANTYGLGTGSVFGHVKLSDATNSATAASDSIAATPKAVRAAMEKAVEAYELASSAAGGASGCVPLAGGTMTGLLKMPTPAAKLNDTTVATTAWVHREMLNIVYPVGSIYMSVNNVSPQSFLGGTWAALSGRFLIAANSTYTSGSTGGAATHKIAEAELPAHTHTVTIKTSGKHTHTRGTMDITGSIPTGARFFQENGSDGWTSGAFSYWKRGEQDGDTSGDSGGIFKFTASKKWTGKTSEEPAHGHTATASKTGSGTAMPILPPYLAVYMWKRTA